MGSKIAGVALAAVVGACALGGGVAEANVLAFNFSYMQDYGDYDIGVSGSGITNIGAKGAEYVVDVSYSSIRIGVPDFAKHYQIKTFSGFTYAGVYYQDQYGDYINYAYSDPFISFGFNIGPNGTSFDGYSSSSLTPCCSGVFNASASGSVGSGFLVPLPSTAPLFGSAFLALGCATIMRRRAEKKRAAQAA